MANLKSQTIGKVTCPECGKPTPLKVNKNGIAYYFCGNYSMQTDGPCSHHQKWSRARSVEFQTEYLRKRAANDNKRHQIAANDNGENVRSITPEPETYDNEAPAPEVDRAAAENDNEPPNVTLPEPPNALFGAF